MFLPLNFPVRFPVLKNSIMRGLRNKILITRAYQDKVKKQKTVPLPRGIVYAQQ